MERVLIRGRRVSLIPADPSLHLDVLLGWRNSQDWLEYCTHKKEIISREEYLAEMSGTYIADRNLQFIIESRGTFVGATHVYGLDMIDGHAWFTMFLDSNHRRIGLGIDAGALLCAHLFTQHDICKICTGVYSHNTTILNLHKKLGFVRHKSRGQHRMSNGDWRDIHFFAISRADAEGILSTRFSHVF